MAGKITRQFACVFLLTGPYVLKENSCFFAMTLYTIHVTETDNKKYSMGLLAAGELKRKPHTII